MTLLHEHLTKTIDSLSFAASDLNEAHKGCSAVLSFALLPLLQETRELQRKIASLLSAVRSDAEQR